MMGDEWRCELDRAQDRRACFSEPSKKLKSSEDETGTNNTYDEQLSRDAFRGNSTDLDEYLGSMSGSKAMS